MNRAKINSSFGKRARGSSLFVHCLFDQSNGSFGSRDNPTAERFRMTSKPTSVCYKPDNGEFRTPYLVNPGVYSMEGRIGDPLSSIGVKISNTASTDATAIQMLSYANQRPGHILENVMRSEGRSDSGPHLLPNPNAGQGSSFMPASAFFSWSAKRSGLNFRGSGYVRLSWRMALTDSQVYNLKNNIRVPYQTLGKTVLPFGIR